MKIVSVVVTMISLFLCASNVFANEGLMKRITENIVRVCDKPEDAGKYWDMKVKGNGEAEIKLILGEIGLTGGAEFSKGEWQGIRTTIENNRDYRDCVKQLTPIFLEKFISVTTNKTNSESRPRILGGVRWLEYGLGLEMTLDSCVKKSSSVSCVFYANANDYDLELYVYGSSAIYNQDGHKFNSNFVSIANFSSALKKASSKLIGELVKKVKTKVTIRFPDVGEDSRSISKATVKAYIKGKGASDYYNFEFRDIKISI